MKDDYDLVFNVQQAIGNYIDGNDDRQFFEFLHDLWYMLNEVLHGDK